MTRIEHCAAQDHAPERGHGQVSLRKDGLRWQLDEYSAPRLRCDARQRQRRTKWPTKWLTNISSAHQVAPTPGPTRYQHHFPIPIGFSSRPGMLSTGVRPPRPPQGPPHLCHCHNMVDLWRANAVLAHQCDARSKDDKSAPLAQVLDTPSVRRCVRQPSDRNRIFQWQSAEHNEHRLSMAVFTPAPSLLMSSFLALFPVSLPVMPTLNKEDWHVRPVTGLRPGNPLLDIRQREICREQR